MWYKSRRAFVAFSEDGGVTFGKPVQIGNGKPIGRST
jgi:hypothetical protein